MTRHFVLLYLPCFGSCNFSTGLLPPNIRKEGMEDGLIFRAVIDLVARQNTEHTSFRWYTLLKLDLADACSACCFESFQRIC